jgi:acetylornithine deacetylase/succinyl-diaminopimelate desuccinylase family protein
MSPTAALLRDLIAIPSVNPAFLPAGDKNAGEQGVAAFLERRARSAGLKIVRQIVSPGRYNLLTHLKPVSRKVASTVLLAPHLDTVNATAKSFKPWVSKGRLYGRGACDTKGSVAAMFSALLEVAGKQRPQTTQIIFIGLADEENGQTGSRKIASRGLKADLAIVGEPTMLEVFTAHKGSLWLRLETVGKAAHGSRPDLGENAVHAMAQVVHLLETKYRDFLRKRNHPLLGHATVSVGSIRGGTQANIVPDHCQILVDRRTLPGETEKSVEAEINAFLKTYRLQARLVSDKLEPCLPLDTEISVPLVRNFLKCAGQKKPAGTAFFTDAGVLAAGGIPSIVFGPGDIKQAHTVDEWVSLDAVEQAKELLVKFLTGLP